MSGKFGGGGVPCTVCTKTVYPAETIQFEKKPYHVECFTCTECTKKISAATAAQYDEKIFCRHCFDKGGYAQKQRNVKWQPKKTAATGTSSKFGGGGTPCTVCAKTVYPAETIRFEGKSYHADCLKCDECSKKLKLSDAAQFENKTYCLLCFDRGGYRQKQTKQGTWQKKEGGTNNAVASKFGGGGTPCTICQNTVYPAEMVQYEKKPYHTSCFKCSECGVKKSPSSMASYEDKLYCMKCFQSGGYSQKQRNVKWEKKEGSSTSNPLSSKFGGGGNPCTICAKTVYPAETLSYEKKIYHVECFKCDETAGCGKKMTSSGANQYEGQLFCTKCFKDGGYREKQAKTAKKVSGAKTYDSRFAKFGGGGNKCVVCTETVYPAETVSFEKKIYHAKCFKCLNCSKILENPSYADGNKDGVYCKKCFRELNLHMAKLEIKD